MQTSQRQITEAQLQAAIIELAGYLGYRHFHPLYSPGSDRGYPDLTLVRPARPDRPGRVIWAELKGPRGVVSDAQQEWHDDLVAAGAEAYIWTPMDWPGQIRAILEGERP